MHATILITGATGNVGAEVTRLLRAAGQPVRAAVRDPARAAAQLGEQIDYVRFDFRDPATFAPALRGAAGLFLVRPPEIADVGSTIEPLIAAAKQAGVSQVVFLSLLGAESNRLVPHHAIEAAIRAADIGWTFLRASFFMQNLSTTHRADIRERGEIFVPAGQGKTSFIDVRDIAAVAALALTEPGHRGQAHALTGDAALSYAEVAQIMSEELGRPIRYPQPSALAFYRHMRRRGYLRAHVMVMIAIYTVARMGKAGAVTSDTARLLGRPAGSVRDFVRDYRACWE